MWHAAHGRQEPHACAGPGFVDIKLPCTAGSSSVSGLVASTGSQLLSEEGRLIYPSEVSKICLPRLRLLEDSYLLKTKLRKSFCDTLHLSLGHQGGGSASTSCSLASRLYLEHPSSHRPGCAGLASTRPASVGFLRGKHNSAKHNLLAGLS